MNEQTQLVNYLLELARKYALNEIGPVVATPHNLDLLAQHARGAVLAQVRVGLWAKLGVTDPEQMAGLKVTAVLGQELFGEPPIKLEYDFTKTKLPMLTMKSVRVS